MKCPGYPFCRAWWCWLYTATATRWWQQNKSCTGAHYKPQFACYLLPNSRVPSMADWYLCSRNPIDSHLVCNIRLYKSYSEISLIENLLEIASYGVFLLRTVKTNSIIYLSFAQYIYLKTKRYSADHG